MGFKTSSVPRVHYFAVLLVAVAIQKTAFSLNIYSFLLPFFQLPSTFFFVVYTSTVWKPSKHGAELISNSALIVMIQPLVCIFRDCYCFWFFSFRSCRKLSCALPKLWSNDLCCCLYLSPSVCPGTEIDHSRTRVMALESTSLSIHLLIQCTYWHIIIVFVDIVSFGCQRMKACLCDSSVRLRWQILSRFVSLVTQTFAVVKENIL